MTSKVFSKVEMSNVEAFREVMLLAEHDSVREKDRRKGEIAEAVRVKAVREKAVVVCRRVV